MNSSPATEDSRVAMQSSIVNVVSSTIRLASAPLAFGRELLELNNLDLFVAGGLTLLDD
jgi:hypothetical protein